MQTGTCIQAIARNWHVPLTVPSHKRMIGWKEKHKIAAGEETGCSPSLCCHSDAMPTGATT
jgi:hypothetical protein